MAKSIGALSLSRTLFLIKIFAVISLFLAPHGSHALKLPFRPTDILPLLPQQLSRPIINYLRHGRIAEDNLPVFVGAASASDTANIQWKAPCFDHNSAWLELHNKSGTPFGGGALHIKVSKAHTWYCDDTYLFATAYRVKWDYFFLSREHIIEFDQWISKAELEYVKTTGVSTFITDDFDLLGALHMLREVFPLITSEGWSERSNINFLQKHMEASFMIRPKRRWISTNISTDDIHSGDLLAISRFRGRQGGIQTLEKWVTGSYAGHIAVFLKDEGGKLWVGESGRENDEGEAVIAILPWEEWWEFELKNDYSIPNIALLPLSPDIRAKFNESAAWEYAKSMDGLPYSYHNLIFSWIDTYKLNYPEPLDPHVMASAVAIWNQVQPANAANVWNEGFNKRLGTEGLGFAEILDELHRRGSCFAQILPIPEQDDWVYSDGKSTSCAAFVLGMYKEAGLFGPLSSLIQVTEFTIKDAYSLRFFEEDKNRLPKWCNDPYKLLPFCQILGKYLMELPGYNSMEPYAHMNERCPSMPPKYRRPVGC